MDSDDDLDDSFYSAIDQLVAQHKTQQPPIHQRGSQPGSPLAAAAAPRPAGLVQQPLQQVNGLPGTALGGSGHASGHMHKPPLGPPPRQHHHGPPAMGAHLGHGALPAGGGGYSGLPPGRVTLAAAELRAQQPPAHWQQQQQQQQAVAQDPQARLAQLQAECEALHTRLSSAEGSNKLLKSNVDHKERELAALRQQLKQQQQQQQQQGGGGGGASSGGGGRGGLHQSAFAVGDMSKQLDSLRQQLLFKEQEAEDLKRQHADRTERLRQAEASMADLKEQLKRAGQQAGAAAAAAAAAAAGGQAGPAAPQQHHRQQQQQDGRRSSGQKRRQSASGSGAAADPPCAGEQGLASVGAAAPAPASAAVAAPLLDPAVLAAASSLVGSSSIVAQLLAACSGSMALLVGAAPGGAAPREAAEAAAAAAAPTALLLRSQLAAAARTPDAESLQFVAAFSQRMQQAACSVLPLTSLLDCIGSLVAASVVQLHTSSSSGGGEGGSSSSSSSLPQQRVQLIAAGLQVAQQLTELDAGCRAAALGAGSTAGGGGSSSSSSGPAARQRLSNRVQLSSGPAGAAAAAAAVAVAPGQAASNSSGSSSSSPGLPATALLMQQHPAVFEGLGSDSSNSSGGERGLLPVALGAALWLGPQHEAVAAGALGTALELARGLQGEGGRGMLAPVLTSGAMELFMRPLALRLQAVRLLQLLLEDASLAQLFEGSLAQAAAARGEPGLPTATAASGGCGSGSATPGREVQPRLGGGYAGRGNGSQPMQVDGVGDGDGEARGAGPWIGAAAIAERLLDSFVLDDGMLGSHGCHGSSSSSSSSVVGVGGGVGGRRAEGSLPGGSSGAAVARAAMQLVAALREQRQQGLLVALLLDDACGAPGCMLAQRLVQLAEAATAVPGEEAALMLLCPAQWPQADGGAGGGGGAVLAAQAAWQQRLRVAQEALTLLRGLLVDDSCGIAAMDDLVTIPAAARLTLTTLSRLSRLEQPQQQQPPGEGFAAAAAAGSPQALALAPWARAIGSSTDQASIACEAGGGSAVAAAAALGGGAVPRCSVEDVVYMARSLRRRVLSRMQSAALVQG